MAEQQLCQNCGQRQTCQAVYEAMSGQKGPSVTLRVVVVFLLPMLVFIGSLVAGERLLAGLVTARGVQTLLSFFAATFVTLVWIWVVKKIGTFIGWDL